MKIISLSASLPIRKTYTLKDGQPQAAQYPNISLFTSTEHAVDTPEDLLQVVSEVSTANACLLKGLINQPLLKQSRAGATKTHTPTEWICLDIDGLPGYKTAESFLRALGAPFTTSSCVVQYSASMGIKDAALRCHLFFLLAQPIDPTLIKGWLYRVNYAKLADHITLNRNGLGLRFPLDVSTCQNDKLLYVASPKLGKGVTTTLVGERIQLITKRNTHLTYNFTTSFKQTAQDLTATFISKRNELRLAQNLPILSPQDYTLIDHEGEVYSCLTKGEPPVITGQRQDQDFVRFNFNGGDSWGYYHRIGSPQIIFNFKGEEPIYTPILLPDYWNSTKPTPPTTPTPPKETKEEVAKSREERLKKAEERRQATQEAKQAAQQERLKDKEAKLALKEAKFLQAENNPIAEDGYRYFAVIARDSHAYWRGRYNPETQDIEMFTSTRTEFMRHYFAQYNQIEPEYFPQWDVTFEFDNQLRIDFDQRKINLYEHTPYTARAKPTKLTPIPPTIQRILFHALGSCPESFKAFTNWLAYIIQFRVKSRIAWVLHGTQGTGKGILFEHILTPLFGSQHTSKTSMGDLAASQYNNYMKQSIFCLIDEASVEDVQEKPKITARLKEYITEDSIFIRDMFLAPYKTKNYTNFLVFSNETNPTIIAANDRRWSVAKRQNTPIPRPSAEDFQAISDELAAFTDYLNSYQVDVLAATTPFINDDRIEMKEISRSGREEVAQRILDGDLEYFYLERPENPFYLNTLQEKCDVLLPNYNSVLKRCLEYPDRISRNDLRTLVTVITGNPSQTSHMFSKSMAHAGLRMKNMKIDGVLVRGIGNLNWSCSDEIRREIELLGMENVVQIRKDPSNDSDKLRPSVRASENEAQNSTRSSRVTRNNASSRSKPR